MTTAMPSIMPKYCVSLAFLTAAVTTPALAESADCARPREGETFDAFLLRCQAPAPAPAPVAAPAPLEAPKPPPTPAVVETPASTYLGAYVGAHGVAGLANPPPPASAPTRNMTSFLRGLGVGAGVEFVTGPFAFHASGGYVPLAAPDPIVYGTGTIDLGWEGQCSTSTYLATQAGEQRVESSIRYACMRGLELGVSTMTLGSRFQWGLVGGFGIAAGGGHTAFLAEWNPRGAYGFRIVEEDWGAAAWNVAFGFSAELLLGSRELAPVTLLFALTLGAGGPLIPPRGIYEK